MFSSTVLDIAAISLEIYVIISNYNIYYIKSKYHYECECDYENIHECK